MVVGAGMTVALMRMDQTAVGLRRLAGQSGYAAARHLPVLDGRKGADVTRLAGSPKREAFAAGTGRCCAAVFAFATQEAKIAGWVRVGPDLATAKIVRWCCADIQARIAEPFGVSLHERSVGKLLRRLRFSRVPVRPQHPKADLAAQASFETGSRPL